MVYEEHEGGSREGVGITLDSKVPVHNSATKYTLTNFWSQLSAKSANTLICEPKLYKSAAHTNHNDSPLTHSFLVLLFSVVNRKLDGPS